ncbi:MAG: hypothetical protein CVU39_24585 [Chloroflexi bacterium HGW-Chloroflexi-10]|jgi:ABC-type transport system involved in cytochrome c biogenesis permease subunit|nr:MAG: hypothetical protein CVU39_24585 [Chloroflexi bacterium HGW-Chloroflexi-10]
MQPIKSAPVDRKTKIFNLALASITAQVGCLTLLIILGAVFGGLWLDNVNGTKPAFTLGFLIASIPVSLAVMFFIVKFGISKIKTNQKNLEKEEQEADIGRNS